ncbi:MAG: GDP-mannose 4,6-dehydratase [Myxococcaceae bacterium]|nr:GDP-mannose 4,6-dehydratase [Myxococcaceae bacterium]
MSANAGDRPVVIFGGAGFIGSNLAHRLMQDGRRVLVFDSLARPLVDRNLRWLKETHGERLEVMVADTRDAAAVKRAVGRAQVVFHFAAQVAVTTSLVDPLHDFEVNVRGTLHVLEAVRHAGRKIPVFFTSTNKVYGGLPDVALISDGDRYTPVDPVLRRHGVSESRPLDFESPYGCSKGAADQYVLDYARTFGLPTCVFRMSCIYGPRQFGNEDQGWIAHFLIRALTGQRITIFGDGRQVRDALYVGDLVEAFLAAERNLPRVRGQVFNVGGGPERSVSLREVLALIAELVGRVPAIDEADWRPGDQRYYVSDTRRLEALTGWRPKVGVRAGIARLCEWLTGVVPADSAQPAPVADAVPTVAG